MLNPKMRTLTITTIASIVVMAVVLTSFTPSSFASPHQELIQLGESRIMQSTITNATSSPANRTGPLDFITAPIVSAVKSALAPYLVEPHAATIFTIFIAVVVSLVSATTGKLLVDYEMVKQTMREYQAYQRALNKARKEKDEQELAKLMKKQQAMTKLQAKASMEQMKVTAVTFVPFLLLWYLLSAVLGGVVIAQAPFPLPFLGSHLVFWQWYLLCNFSLSLPTYRIFGIGMSDN